MRGLVKIAGHSLAWIRFLSAQLGAAVHFAAKAVHFFSLNKECMQNGLLPVPSVHSGPYLPVQEGTFHHQIFLGNFLGESKWQTKEIRAPTSAYAQQQCLVLVSGIALGVVIFDSAVADWDARPVATDTEVMSRPVAELLFPTVTVCADGDTPPDPMAPIHAYVGGFRSLPIPATPVAGARRHCL